MNIHYSRAALSINHPCCCKLKVIHINTDLYRLVAQITRGVRFGETRPGGDVFHKRYVRTDKSGHCACARMRCMRLAESEPGRIWAHVTGTGV